ncbi:MAG: HD domain-containing protein [Desulfobacterales bacterium]
MNPVDLIRAYYDPAGKAYGLLMRHVEQVARKALAVAARVKAPTVDLAFIESAALLHDIGIFLTDAPLLGCTGTRPYLCHGVLGRELLEKAGLPRHALVCERHVGVGLSREEIEKNRLPLPSRDMRPVSLEEQIVCFADKFFSKNGDGGGVGGEKSLSRIRAELAPFGTDKVAIFDAWARRFGEVPA